jgi:hypothetical protein
MITKIKYLAAGWLMLAFFFTGDLLRWLIRLGALRDSRN